MSAPDVIRPSVRWVSGLLDPFIGPRRERSTRDVLVELLPALSIFALIAFRSQMRDGNTYVHIAAGQWMLGHHAILHSDPFSYTFLGHPWLTQEWLSEIVMAIAFGLGSWPGLDLLFAFTAAATAFLLARALLRHLNPLPALIIQQLALLCILFTPLVRPNALTLPLLIMWTDGLLSARDEKRGPRLAMLPIMLIWANMHASFVVGLFLVAVFGLEAAIAARKSWPQAVRPWIIFGVGAGIATLLTPHGVAGVIFPFQLMSDSALLGLVSEFQSSMFPTVTWLEVFLLATMFFFMVKPARVPPLRLLLFVLLVHMTLEHRRDIDLLATIGSMILARPVAEALNPGSEPAAARTTIGFPLFVSVGAVLVVSLIAGIRLTIPAAPPNSGVTPEAALKHVSLELVRRPVFNDYIFGGYLISRGIRTFIDGRADMYGTSFVKNYVKMIKPDRNAIETTFSKYNVSWTILAPDNPVNEILDLLPGWRVLYKDSFAVVHVRADLQGAERTRAAAR